MRHRPPKSGLFGMIVRPRLLTTDRRLLLIGFARHARSSNRLPATGYRLPPFVFSGTRIAWKCRNPFLPKHLSHARGSGRLGLFDTPGSSESLPSARSRVGRPRPTRSPIGAHPFFPYFDGLNRVCRHCVTPRGAGTQGGNARCGPNATPHAPDRPVERRARGAVPAAAGEDRQDRQTSCFDDLQGTGRLGGLAAPHSGPTVLNRRGRRACRMGFSPCGSAVRPSGHPPHGPPAHPACCKLAGVPPAFLASCGFSHAREDPPSYWRPHHGSRAIIQFPFPSCD